MAFRIGMFFIVILTLIIAGHLYMYRRFLRDLTSSRRLRRWGAAAALFLVLLLILGRMVARSSHGPLAWLANTVSYSWMGFAFFIVLALLVVDAVKLGLLGWRRLRSVGMKDREVTGAAPAVQAPAVDEERRLFLSRAVAGGALLTGAGVGSYGSWRAFHAPEVTELVIPLQGLPRTLEGFSIAQLTDIHVGHFIERRFMDELVRRTNAVGADLVAVTGDLVDGDVASLGHAVAALGNLRSRAGTYFVTGNHEYYSGEIEWTAFLESLGIQVLRNRHVRIGDAGGAFDLVGVDDWKGGLRRGRPGYDLDAALAGRKQDAPAVLLAHQPANFDVAAQKGIGLQISGHTHGGQLFPMTMFIGLAWEFAAGHYQRGDSHIYVSRGCGFWGPPMRVGSPPEIVKLVLTAA